MEDLGEENNWDNLQKAFIFIFRFYEPHPENLLQYPWISSPKGLRVEGIRLLAFMYGSGLESIIQRYIQSTK